MRLSPECGTDARGNETDSKGKSVVLTAYSSGSRPRLSTSALLILLAAEESRHHHRMQAAVHSAYHSALWARSLCVVRAVTCKIQVKRQGVQKPRFFLCDSMEAIVASGMRY